MCSTLNILYNPRTSQQQTKFTCAKYASLYFYTNKARCRAKQVIKLIHQIILFTVRKWLRSSVTFFKRMSTSWTHFMRNSFHVLVLIFIHCSCFRVTQLPHYVTEVVWRINTFAKSHSTSYLFGNKNHKNMLPQTIHVNPNIILMTTNND